MAILNLQIWTPTRKMLLCKETAFERVPVEGESVSFDGIIFARTVTRVYHDASGVAQVWFHALDDLPDRSVAIWSEEEFEEAFAELRQEGWHIERTLVNNVHASLTTLIDVVEPLTSIPIERATVAACAAAYPDSLELAEPVLAAKTRANALELLLRLTPTSVQREGADGLTDAELERIRLLALDLSGDWRCRPFSAASGAVQTVPANPDER